MNSKNLSIWKSFFRSCDSCAHAMRTVGDVARVITLRAASFYFCPHLLVHFSSHFLSRFACSSGFLPTLEAQRLRGLVLALQPACASQLSPNMYHPPFLGFVLPLLICRRAIVYGYFYPPLCDYGVISLPCLVFLIRPRRRGTCPTRLDQCWHRCL